MDKKPEFHGSDIEQISQYYHIPQEEIVSFGANVNPLGLSEHVKEQLASHLDVITRYPDRNYAGLRDTISMYCHADPEHIVVGNGSTELISLLISGLRPKKALVVGPTYSEYARELSLVGGTLEYYNLREEKDFVLDVPELLAALTPDTRLLVICNPNNPTSSALACAQLEEVFRFCKEKGIFVMIDETYAEFAPDPESITAIGLIPKYDNFMVIRGVSKYFAAPGLRFGYGITSSRTFLDVLHRHQNPWSLSSIGAFAGGLMLEDTTYIRKTWNLIDSERTRLYGELCTWEGVKAYRPYANFILVRILRKGLTSSDVFEHAIRHGLMIRDCSSFQSLDGEYIRFCIMKPEDNDRLMACLRGYLGG
ncbi:pyridoxal phosphate-dependent aminotransferase [Dorea sp. D27]|uniref:pyridoxal phosphate-dependent aminotransferase n=1 Tax=Dorea sp. D27 TaxID=658665 RepID=UPI000673264F|nr:histidinol-phosphate transaminase [Dorea sp. D27]KMZ53211.1 putative histidinol-phosphate aminotransferase [Dorea sp. D27]